MCVQGSVSRQAPPLPRLPAGAWSSGRDTAPLIYYKLPVFFGSKCFGRLGKRYESLDEDNANLVRKSPRLQEQQGTAAAAQSAVPTEEKESPQQQQQQQQSPPYSNPVLQKPDRRGYKRKAVSLLDSNDDGNGAANPAPSPTSDEVHHCKRRQVNGIAGAAHNTASRQSNRILYWICHARWPKGDFVERASTPIMTPSKRSWSASSCNDTMQTPSSGGRKERGDGDETKSLTAYYASPRYVKLLEANKSFMYDSDDGLLAAERSMCAALLRPRPDLYPADTLFDDAFFGEAYRRLREQNEARVVRDIALLITPSAEQLTMRGAHALNCLSEGVNLAWNKAIPMAGPRPQPDYGVGFNARAFTAAQLRKLDVGFNDYSYYTATDDIYFPFLTTEVKSSEMLNVADRQNAHSMTLAVRGVVELFRHVKRHMELHRRALAFSISHDDSTVRLYAHYAEISTSDGGPSGGGGGVVVKYYRRKLRSFEFGPEGSDSDGANINSVERRWLAYSFTRNIYEEFMPHHLQRICSAIDQLPDPAVLPSTAASSAAAPSGNEDTGTGTATGMDSGTLSEPLQEDADGFKKPAPPRRVTNATLLSVIEQQRKEMEELRKQAQQEKAELMNLLKQHLGIPSRA